MFERYSVKRIALRQSPCGIPKVVVKACPFDTLFFTCSVTSFIYMNIIYYEYSCLPHLDQGYLTKVYTNVLC